MTVITRSPENTNLLQPTKFLLTFDRIPDVTYFCQEVNIPGLRLNVPTYNTPFVDIPIAGNKLTYNTLTVKFLIDEKIQSWKNIHSWFRALASPESFEERKRLSEIQNQFKKQTLKSYSDGTLTILTGLNNPGIRVLFVNMFPISLSDISFDTTLSADHIITADVEFAFESYDFGTA